MNSRQDNLEALKIQTLQRTPHQNQKMASAESSMGIAATSASLMGTAARSIALAGAGVAAAASVVGAVGGFGGISGASTGGGFSSASVGHAWRWELWTFLVDSNHRGENILDRDTPKINLSCVLWSSLSQLLTQLGYAQDHEPKIQAA